MEGHRLVHTHTHDDIVVQIWAKNKELPPKEEAAEIIDAEFKPVEMKDEK